MAKLELRKIIRLSTEQTKSLSQTPLKVAYHFFVDLAISRGENVTGEQLARAERCRRHSSYKPAFL